MSQSIEEYYRKIPKENYGSISYNRFSYQLYWGILQAFELYKTGKEFYVVFEGSEDIDIVCESIGFYQVKTKKGKAHYTLEMMKKGEDKSSKTPLSKLAEKEHYDGVSSLNIVSNLPFETKYRKKGVDYNRSTISFADYDEVFSSMVVSHIKEKNCFDPDLSKYFFIHSSLPIDDTKTMLLGHTTRFLKEKDIPVQTVEMVLNLIESDAREMMSKEKCDNYLMEKSLSKQKMDGYLHDFGLSRNNLVLECNEIINQFPVCQKSKINSCFSKVIEENFSSKLINDNKRIVRNCIDDNIDKLSSLSSEKEWCEYLKEKVCLKGLTSEGDVLCYIILAVNDYSKGRDRIDE